MKTCCHCVLVCVCICTCVCVCAMLALPLYAYAENTTTKLSLEKAISTAISTDIWLEGSRNREGALKSESVRASHLQDPKVTLIAANFPVDGFDFNQEPMTQLIMGVTQVFPRGDSLKLAQLQKQELAAQEPLLRLERKAKVSLTVSQLWLDVFKAQESIRLIKRDRSLFEHLVGAARANYASALGRSRQQDIIRAQLELTQLNDRLIVLEQQYKTAQQRLSEWIGPLANLPVVSVLTKYDDVELLSHHEEQAANEQYRYDQIKSHPVLLAFDQRIKAMQTGVDLVHQKYKPEWGLTAQYGFRGDDPMGRDRSDFVSVGVTMDLPFFTRNRQDQELNAAASNYEALKVDKQLMVRQMLAELDTAIAQLRQLNARHVLYEQQLFPQMSELSEATLSAYNNNDGDFSEAVRARIAELNAKIEALMIIVERQQVISKIQYLLSRVDETAAPVLP